MPMFPYTARAFLGFNYSAAGSLITPPWCELLRRTFNQICTVPLVPRRFLQLHAVAIAGSRSRGVISPRFFTLNTNVFE